jgi:hypothetical protein
MKNTIIIVGIVGIVVAILYFINENAPVPGSDMTVYPVQCLDWTNLKPPTSEQDVAHCSQPKAAARVAFKIDATNNQVMEWSPDDTNIGIKKLTSCTVVNVQNWTCDEGIPTIMSLLLGSNDGNFFEDDAAKDMIYVSKEQWNSINNGAPSAICGASWCNSTPTIPVNTTSNSSSGDLNSTLQGAGL